MSLAAKHILVTGGSRGIGYAIAHRLASLGGSITLLSTSLPRLEAARSALPKIPGRDQTHTLVHGSVSDAALWDALRRTHVRVPPPPPPGRPELSARRATSTCW